MNLRALINRNMHAQHQNTTFLWWRMDVRLASQKPRAWACFPGDLCVSLGMDLDYDERLVFKCGPIMLTRAETEAERNQREDDWAEEAFMEKELNRYTEWYY